MESAQAANSVCSTSPQFAGRTREQDQESSRPGGETRDRRRLGKAPLAVNVARRKETRLIIEWSSIIVAPGSAPSCFRRVTGRADICISVIFLYNNTCRELSEYSGISTVNRKGQIFLRPMK